MKLSSLADTQQQSPSLPVASIGALLETQLQTITPQSLELGSSSKSMDSDLRGGDGAGSNTITLLSF
jgi:hypothetical protein